MACEKIMAMTKEQVLEIAITAGKILLCSGAETSRVEDTIVRMCALRGMNTVSVFCTPSVIIVSNEFAGDFTCMYRVSRRGTDLGLISEINELSFSFARWQHDYTETMNILREKLNRPPRPNYIETLSSGLAAASFAVVLGGDLYEFIGAFFAAAAAMFVLKKIAPFRPSSFWETTLAGVILCAVALIFQKLIPGNSMEKMTVGAIMPFLPGVAFTNGLRDYMAGDLMSGNTRVSEALLLVGGLAIGMAAVLGIWHA